MIRAGVENRLRKVFPALFLVMAPLALGNCGDALPRAEHDILAAYGADEDGTGCKWHVREVRYIPKTDAMFFLGDQEFRDRVTLTSLGELPAMALFSGQDAHKSVGYTSAQLNYIRKNVSGWLATGAIACREETFQAAFLVRDSGTASNEGTVR